MAYLFVLFLSVGPSGKKEEAKLIPVVLWDGGIRESH